MTVLYFLCRIVIAGVNTNNLENIEWRITNLEYRTNRSMGTKRLFVFLFYFDIRYSEFDIAF
jgi:hypothetical protein